MNLKSELEKTLLLDLADLDIAGPPQIDNLIKHARRSALAESFFKKFEDENSIAADDAAIHKMLEINERCRVFNPSPDTPFLKEVFGEICQEMWTYFSPMSYRCIDYNLPTLLASGGLGPGANLGAKSYNFYTKLFDSTLSTTSAKLHRFYTHFAAHTSKTWFNAELMRANRHDVSIVQGNNLTTVPKNVNISRTICTEPTLNMYYQKGLGRILESQLRSRHLIDLAKQPDINRRMAKQGSISHKFATIDLQSASDTISLNLLHAILPVKFLNLLQLLRSPTSKIGNEEIELHMVSTMGNGFTFPLQTMLFATVVTAVYRVMGIKPITGSACNYSVFGDDIICVKQAYDNVLLALEMLGFIVNKTKSFNVGDFRESCGEDYYFGHNIRGFYCSSLRNQASINATYNGLLLWTLRYNIPMINTLGFLKQFKKHYVPLWADMSAGFYATSESIKTTSIKFLEVKTNKFAPEDLPYRYKQNNDGLMVTLLGGFVRNGTLSLRSFPGKECYRYVTRRIGSPKGGPRTVFCTITQKRIPVTQPHNFVSRVAWIDDLYRIKKLHHDADPTWLSMLDQSAFCDL